MKFKKCEMCSGSMICHPTTDKFFCEKCVYGCSPSEFEKKNISAYASEDNWSLIGELQKELNKGVNDE